tara:strand:- start:340 stop:648 length:309 start_codon:yes stop_codon:yes gene_type:complete
MIIKSDLELKTEAIKSLDPDAQFSIRGDDLDNVNWSTTPISSAEIDAEMERLEAEFIALQYQRDRIYPSLAEQADLQYWDLVNSTTTWKDAIAKVKADNPKI